eukprot:TRINITY_DN48218_c0_g1_i1.p1 TRINITY_DN48218_c0_g1~~TRINITY_DN48218_c0_g1_i1.p1  ORF type:complete len:197 (-),score=23.65 TRINITY_DN48218_c0_g1_i1:187-777(-)
MTYETDIYILCGAFGVSFSVCFTAFILCYVVIERRRMQKMILELRSRHRQPTLLECRNRQPTSSTSDAKKNIIGSSASKSDGEDPSKIVDIDALINELERDEIAQNTVAIDDLINAFELEDVTQNAVVIDCPADVFQRVGAHDSRLETQGPPCRRSDSQDTLQASCFALPSVWRIGVSNSSTCCGASADLTREVGP